MKNLKIFNGTSHAISIYSVEDAYEVQGGRKLVLKPGAEPVMVIPPGTNLNAVTENLPSPHPESPFIKGAVVFTGHDPVPADYDLIVVSNMYRSAVREMGGDTSRLATVGGTVYADESAVRPVGCTNLFVG